MPEEPSPHNWGSLATEMQWPIQCHPAVQWGRQPGTLCTVTPAGTAVPSPGLSTLATLKIHNPFKNPAPVSPAQVPTAPRSELHPPGFPHGFIFTLYLTVGDFSSLCVRVVTHPHTQLRNESGRAEGPGRGHFYGGCGGHPALPRPGELPSTRRCSVNIC